MDILEVAFWVIGLFSNGFFIGVLNKWVEELKSGRKYSTKLGFEIRFDCLFLVMSVSTFVDSVCRMLEKQIYLNLFHFRDQTDKTCQRWLQWQLFGQRRRQNSF